MEQIEYLVKEQKITMKLLLNTNMKSYIMVSIAPSDLTSSYFERLKSRSLKIVMLVFRKEDVLVFMTPNAQLHRH